MRRQCEVWQFAHADGRTATLSYGTTSDDLGAWLVSVAPREDIFPDAHHDQDAALAALHQEGFVFAAVVDEWIDQAGYVTERPAGWHRQRQAMLRCQGDRSTSR